TVARGGRLGGDRRRAGRLGVEDVGAGGRVADVAGLVGREDREGVGAVGLPGEVVARPTRVRGGRGDRRRAASRLAGIGGAGRGGPPAIVNTRAVEPRPPTWVAGNVVLVVVGATVDVVVGEAAVGGPTDGAVSRV